MSTGGSSSLSFCLPLTEHFTGTVDFPSFSPLIICMLTTPNYNLYLSLPKINHVLKIPNLMLPNALNGACSKMNAFMPKLRQARHEGFILDSCSLFRPTSYAVHFPNITRMELLSLQPLLKHRQHPVLARLPNSSLISRSRLSNALTSYMAWAIYLMSRYFFLFNL